MIHVNRITTRTLWPRQRLKKAFFYSEIASTIFCPHNAEKVENETIIAHFAFVLELNTVKEAISDHLGVIIFD